MSDPIWNTPSMAELYIQQGHHEQGLETYRAYVAEHPEDQRAQSRLHALERNLENGTLPRGVMDFRQALQELVEQVDHAQSAMLMGFDGIAIESYAKPGETLDLPTLLVEYANVCQQINNTRETVPGIGGLRELVVRRDDGTSVLKPLTPEYFVAIQLRPEAIVGKASSTSPSPRVRC